MKKTLFTLVALATAFAAVSCQKSDEEFAQQPINKPMVINAVAEGIGTDAKATMAYKYDILWSTGDQIYVDGGYNGGYRRSTYTLKNGAGTKRGIFEYTSGSVIAPPCWINAYYPVSIFNTSTNNAEWPAVQKNPVVVPMHCGKALEGSATEEFSFASLGSMLQIVFTTKQEDVTLKSITLKDGNVAMSGGFIIQDGKAVIDNYDKAGITLDLGEGVPVGLEAKYFYIAVPANTYSDLTITFTATDGSKCTFEHGNISIEYNTVSRLVLSGTEFKFFGQGWAPVKDEALIPGDKVKWIQLWANGPKFAEFNIGAQSIAEFGDTFSWGTDIVSARWGDNWRMLTYDDLNGIYNNTTRSVVTDYDGKGTDGAVLSGMGDYKDNSVFFPATTAKYSYWSSTPYQWSGYVWYFYINFTSKIATVGYGPTTQIGNSYVRAVLDETVQE